MFIRMENPNNIDDHIYYEESRNENSISDETNRELANAFLVPYDDRDYRKRDREENIDNYYN